MKTKVLYIHGKGGSAAEAEHYKPLFKNAETAGLDYRAELPWEAKEEFPFLFDAACRGYDEVILIANSLGAWFAMHALADQRIRRAYLISPVVDMEKLIRDMMREAGITEARLKEEKELTAPSGELLSWEYLTYVKEHPLTWNIPSLILYGEKDALTSLETISAFADRTGAELTVMKNGEHWFHTKEQMAFLDTWIEDRERTFGS